MKITLTNQEYEPVGNCSEILLNSNKVCITQKYTKVTTSPKEIWVVPDLGGRCVISVKFVPNKVSICSKNFK